MAGKKLDETEIQIAIADLQQRMGVVEQGVANFRSFQARASQFFDTHDAREKERDKIDSRRARVHLALLTALLTFMVGCAVALFAWIISGHHTISDVPQIVSQNQQNATTHYTAR